MTHPHQLAMWLRMSCVERCEAQTIGNTVEWFDFAIYGFLATYIAEKFFPSGDETAALLNTSRSSPQRSSCGRSAVSSSDR